MQTTDTYQFKLIENSDDFSPVPINQNTQAMEDALSALAATLADKARVAVGSYTGSGKLDTPTTVNVGFAPRAVLAWAGIHGKNYSLGEFAPYLYCGGATASAPLGEILTLTASGFTVKSTMVVLGDSNYYEYPQLNAARAYNYLAIG